MASIFESGLSFTIFPDPGSQEEEVQSVGSGEQSMTEVNQEDIERFNGERAAEVVSSGGNSSTLR